MCDYSDDFSNITVYPSGDVFVRRGVKPFYMESSLNSGDEDWENPTTRQACEDRIKYASSKQKKYILQQKANESSILKLEIELEEFEMKAESEQDLEEYREFNIRYRKGIRNVCDILQAVIETYDKELATFYAKLNKYVRSDD